ncbi:MAG: SurA N-terminal domain-containing protein [Prevotella sp.]
MAALGTIRKRGAILVAIIGLGLFAFIAEEFVRSCEATGNAARQQVGEVLGEKISVQEFQALVDEYQEVVKMTQGRENLTEDELNGLKDQVWNTYVNNAILANEAKKVGLTVTDEELQNILREGKSQILKQTPFVNQQTGLFDVSMLTKFLSDYKNIGSQNPQIAEQYRTIYSYWKFIEKTLRQQTLNIKYQNLLANSLISNPISAKMAFEGQYVDNSVELASIAYTTISDDKIQVSDADLKAKYDEDKEKFKQYIESRDIKYVDFQVKPSDKDRGALLQTMKEAAENLKEGNNPSEVTRKAKSVYTYTGVPVTRKAYSNDIATRIDSMSVGETTSPFETKYDNTMNVVKLISKVQLPDSVEYRQIQIGGETVEAARKTADSVYAALQAGADFDEIAKKYNQTGSKAWFTTAMYENSQSFDADTKQYIETLNNLGTNEIKNLEFAQGNIILQVTNRKAMVDKYVAAVVKHTIDFSKDTYSAAYNKFSQFVSENQTLDAMEKNASKYGFTVQERKDLTNAEHGVNGIRSTRDALKWIFEAKAGEVSPLYECGDNDRMMVIAMTKIHPVGYRALEDVKDIVKSEVIRDKKFEQLSGKLAGAKSISEAKSKGADVTEIAQVTFNAPAFVPATRTSEPALSGAVAVTKQGQFCPRVIKGNGGAFMVKVKTKAQRAGEKFDSKAFEKRLHEQAMMAANPNRLIGELYLKSDVVDNRYLFF